MTFFLVVDDRDIAWSRLDVCIKTLGIPAVRKRPID